MLKNNIKWLKKNLPGDLKIWKELISEVDWKDFAKKQKNKLELDKQRVSRTNRSTSSSWISSA